MAVIEKTSGVWNIDGHWVRADAGSVITHDDSLEAFSVDPADAAEVARRVTSGEDPIAHRGQVRTFDAGPMVSKVDWNYWTAEERPAFWVAADATALAKYAAREAA